MTLRASQTGPRTKAAEFVWGTLGVGVVVPDAPQEGPG